MKEIIDLIATGPPIFVVIRSINSFNKVINCRRKPSEDLKMFLARYRGLEAEHLMRVGASSSSQVSEVLAITLLKNANLSDAILTIAKMKLIRFAEEHKNPHDDQNSYTVSRLYLEAFFKV